MKRLKIFALIIASWLVSAPAIAQDGVGIGSWRTHLPYQKVIGVEPVGQKVYAATEYELFYYDKDDNSVNILNKVNGLSDIGISKIRYNESQRKLFVAYTNANVDLIDAHGNVHNMYDIKNKNISGNKTINNVRFKGDLAYLACSFGIVVFDLKNEEVKDTYYIGQNGDMVNVTDIAFYDGSIYASSDDGVYRASENASQLANYSAWSFVTDLIHPHLAYNMMEVFAGRLLLNHDGGFNADTLFVYDGSQCGYFNKSKVSQKRDIRTYGDRVVTTNRYDITVYDLNLNQIQQIYSPSGAIEPWATAIDNAGDFWIGDTRRGLIKTSDGWNGMDVLPNGPAAKNAFQLQSNGTQVWIATGGYASNWSKRYLRDGVACLDGFWTSYNEHTVPELTSFTDFICTATHPNDPSTTYVGTWGRGVLKLTNGQLAEVYNAENSSLDYWTSDPNLINISGLAFDSKGNLWVANTGASNLLSVMQPNGDWHSFNLGGTLGGIDIGTLVIDANDYKWIIRRNGEVIVFNDNGTLTDVADDQVMVLNTTPGHGGLTGAVNCLAVDRNGVVWIGTDNGPCFISNPANIFNGSNYDAEVKEVVRNDGTMLKDALFAGSSVRSMAVDGANQVWFGLESGVYLMSFDKAPRQVLNFNSDNSPLLENTVTTMAIDDSGEVFFGTASGIISYRAQATTPSTDVEEVTVYPNPVYPEYDGYVGINGLVKESVVRITTVDGTFVTQLVSEGGQAVWDCTSIDGRKVSPGVYLIFTSNRMGYDKLATKVLILN